MKTKIVVGFCILLTLIILPMSAFADVSAKQGDKITVEFPYSGCSLTAQFIYSNPDVLTVNKVLVSGDLDGSADGSSLVLYNTKDGKVTQGTITLVCTVNKDAAPDSSCTITLAGITGTSDYTDMEYKNVQVVTVVGADTPDNPNGNDDNTPTTTTSENGSNVEPETDKPAADAGDKNGAGAAQSAQTTDKAKETETDANGNPVPANEEEPIVLETLENAINEAEALSEDAYTSDSWNAMQEALVKAKAVYEDENRTQEDIDTATTDLQNALANLKEVDYTELKKAIDEAKKLTDSTSAGQSFLNLKDGILEANDLLASKDQNSIDQMAAKLNGQITDLKKSLNSIDTGDCNIKMHKLWPIFFFGSLAINFGLLAIVLAQIIKVRKKQKDTVPDVEYDIAEDDMYMESEYDDDILNSMTEEEKASLAEQNGEASENPEGANDQAEKK